MKENEKKNSLPHNVSLVRPSRDIANLSLPDFIEMRVDPADTTLIGLTLDLTSEVESIWMGAKLDFTVTVDDDYPLSSPRVHCNTPVLHPNIDTDGSVGI